MTIEMLINIAAGIAIMIMTIFSAIEMTAIGAAISAFFLNKAHSIGMALRSLRLQKETKGTLENARKYNIEYEDRDQAYVYVITAGDETLTCYSEDAYIDKSDVDGLVRMLKDEGKLSAKKSKKVKVVIKKNGETEK